uniref:Uncharacterized protein n=1 Tax=Rhizophora mucronata TaxID=61149 RepID=A0A2P2L3N2_RHIMU
MVTGVRLLKDKYGKMSFFNFPFALLLQPLFPQILGSQASKTHRSVTLSSLKKIGSTD